MPAAANAAATAAAAATDGRSDGDRSAEDDDDAEDREEAADDEDAIDDEDDDEDEAEAEPDDAAVMTACPRRPDDEEADCAADDEDADDGAADADFVALDMMAPRAVFGSKFARGKMSTKCPLACTRCTLAASGRTSSGKCSRIRRSLILTCECE